MRSKNILVTAFALIMCMSTACASIPIVLAQDATEIKSGLESEGLIAHVVYVENSTYGLPGYLIVINATDGDYLAATTHAMVAAAGAAVNYSKCTIIGLIGPDENAYQFKINNIDIPDMRYEINLNEVDASKERAERYFDSATVTTPQELMAYFGPIPIKMDLAGYAISFDLPFREYGYEIDSGHACIRRLNFDPPI